MKTLTCDGARRHLDEFVGEDLAPENAAAVRVHLRDCVQCRNAAGSLQRAMKGLRALAVAGHPAVDESMFASMHADITATIAREVAVDPPRSWGRRVLPLAAAATLFACGWWLVRDPDRVSVFDRPPIVLIGVDGPLKAVPWSGPRVPLRQLGDERPESEGPSDGTGPGMMGRWRLRTLEGTDAPLVPRASWQQKLPPNGRDR